MRKLGSLVKKPRKEPVFEQHEYQEFMELLYKVRKIFDYYRTTEEQNRQFIRLQNEIKRIEAQGLEITKEMAKRQKEGKLTPEEVDRFLKAHSDDIIPVSP